MHSSKDAPPQNPHLLVQSNLNLVLLGRDVANGIRVIISWPQNREMTLDYPNGSNVITGAPESRGGRQKQTSEREVWSMRGAWPDIAWWGVGVMPGMKAALMSKNQPLAHSQTHDQKELDLANQKEPRCKFSPEPLYKSQACQHLDFGLWDPGQRNQPGPLTSNLHPMWEWICVVSSS